MAQLLSYVPVVGVGEQNNVLEGIFLLFQELEKELLAVTSAGDASLVFAPEYVDMQSALLGKPGTQMGDFVNPGVPPNYPNALELSANLLKSSRHVALLTAFTRAATGAHGFEGLDASLHLMFEVCSRQWSTVYPVADEQDPDDPWWERVNLFREVTDDPLIGNLLYRDTVVEIKHIGAFSIRDIDIAAGRRDASEEEKERCNPNFIKAAFTESDTDKIGRIHSAMTRAIGTCDEFDALLAEHVGASVSMFFTLKQIVEKYHSVYREYAGEVLEAVEITPVVADEPESLVEKAEIDNPPLEKGQVVSVQPRLAASRTVTFEDRDSVIQALDNIIKFYQKHEPSSPVPILIYRARDMVYGNFFDILRELAPNHKDNFQELTAALKKDPLGFMLEHSYYRSLKGEAVETAAIPNRPDREQGVGGINSPPASEASDSNEEFSSREQVLQSLRDVQEYFEAQEPSSPVPLIVKRVCELVPKSFVDLLSEFQTSSEDKKEAKKPTGNVAKEAASNEAG